MSRSKRTVACVELLFISGFVIKLAVTLTGVYSVSCLWSLETGSDDCSLQQVPKHEQRRDCPRWLNASTFLLLFDCYKLYSRRRWFMRQYVRKLSRNSVTLCLTKKIFLKSNV